MLGTGLLQGLAVTAKNFVGSFHDPARYTTVEYPEVKPKLPEAYRNFPFLVTENATDPMGTLRCVACQICEKECPPQCIYIEKSKDKKPDASGKMQLYPAIFDIDTSVCMSCQICVEVCPFDAIKMDQVFEIATTERFNALLLHREDLGKPNEYYHAIHPTEAAEVDARLAAERKAADEKAKAAAAAKAAAPARPAAPAAAGSAAAAPASASVPAAPAAVKPAATAPAAPVPTPPVSAPASQLPAAPSAEAPKAPPPAA
ncbi:4Fe-4S dicluster domain-containing protein [Horticoccus sp. 23ND18S-11]|uniref:4Fe-4S dicluster domain-containing protein n=1 Tax=Horticoccus sp. 23ND18S-11 TaxID=3391832 RepID=UPI0039C99861